ncbi:Vacuolar protein sorting-associated protein 20 [Pichia californica]|uniref:Vacuolar protein sorting-associated protein 20 n=1 Tax=Pichia californica TaxID=460514 RepID=A0A9P7BG97_9ASCO|nr:Vacuolar protein sorting-associated protein 20 [[Candida] californica]KAG0689761.1 Vacuolar protein sorting-associated protein 20 [[Candida] californica]
MGNTTSSTSPSNPKITAHDKAVLQLKLQRDKVFKSKQKLEVIINHETKLAKKFIKSKELEKAKLTLRKKKRQESLLNNLERQINTLEELIDTIEFKLIEKDVLYGLEQGNKVLKEINNEMSIEKIDKIMDDTADAIAYQNELSERLGTQLTNGEEDEVDEELRLLEIEMGVVKSTPHVIKEDTTKVKQKLDSIPVVPSNIITNEDQEIGGEEEEEENDNRVSQLA